MSFSNNRNTLSLVFINWIHLLHHKGVFPFSIKNCICLGKPDKGLRVDFRGWYESIDKFIAYCEGNIVMEMWTSIWCWHDIGFYL